MLKKLPFRMQSSYKSHLPLHGETYKNGNIVFPGNEHENCYYVTREGEVRIPKEHSDGREPSMRIMPIERGIEDFFTRFTRKRPEDITISVVSKSIGNQLCEEVFAEILKIYNRGVRIRCRKLTCTVDSVERCQLLIHMFQCVEYEILGPSENSELELGQLSQYVLDCPKSVHIDQFKVDIRQITAKNLYVNQARLTLEEFIEFCRPRTKEKNGKIRHLTVTHGERVDLDDIITQERRRLNPSGTTFRDYTTYGSSFSSTSKKDDHWEFLLEFRWYML